MWNLIYNFLWTPQGHSESSDFLMITDINHRELPSWTEHIQRYKVQGTVSYFNISGSRLALLSNYCAFYN
jgi:hypothetical protein